MRGIGLALLMIGFSLPLPAVTDSRANNLSRQICAFLLAWAALICLIAGL